MFPYAETEQYEAVKGKRGVEKKVAKKAAGAARR